MALDLSRLDGEVPATPSRGVPPSAPPRMFEEDPGQPRREFEEDAAFLALAEDIRLRGLLQPLVVRRLPDGRLRIRFGARRYRAAVHAGMTAIPYVETEDERQFDDYAQVAENAHRQPLQPLELGQFVARKLADGETRRAIAARLEMDASAVTHLLALAVEPPALLLELYYSRRCRAPYYLYLLRKLMRKDAALVAQRLEQVRHVDLATIEAMTEEVRRKTAMVSMASAGADASGAAAQAAPPVRAPQTSRPGRSARSFHIRVLGTHRGRAMELLLLESAPTGQGWLQYEDDQERRLVSLEEVRLTEVRSGGSHAGEAATGL